MADHRCSANRLRAYARLFLFLLLGAQPPVASGDWRVLAQEDQAGGLTHRLAIVDSPAGERLAVYRDLEQNVHGKLRLREGLETLAPSLCPTFRVDSRRPMVLSGGEGLPCEIASNNVEFFLGKIRDGRIVSPVLLQLMNGNTAWFRYRLEHVGYVEAAFGLQRSKQALAEIIGADVEVVWR